jgi:HSP20 family protein
LGETLDTDRVQADYADGVLTIRLPIAEKAKPRRVEINVEDKSHGALETGSREGAARSANGD